MPSDELQYVSHKTPEAYGQEAVVFIRPQWLRHLLIGNVALD